MKKVLFVTPVAPWKLFGGTATVSRNLAALFLEFLGAQVCCLRGHAAGNYPQEIQGARVLSAPVSGLVRQLKFFFDFQPASFAHRQFDRDTVRARFSALLAEQQPDLIIFDHIFSAWLVDLVENPTTRIAYIAHDDMVAYADSLLHLQPSPVKRLRFASLRRQYAWLQDEILRRSDFTLTMTPEDAALLRKSTSGTVEVAPLYFDFPEFLRDEPAEFQSLLVTGSFDTWEKQLGLTQFLDSILPPLLQRRPDFRLVIAGRIPPALRSQIRLGEPQVRVVQAPSGAEMQGLLEKASAAVVLDLQSSGLKIKTIDLAAAGLPLVSWAPGLEGTGLVSGESCLLASSTEEFAAHLERLASDSDLRRKLGKAARNLVQTKFSREAARQRLLNSALYTAAAGAMHPAA